MPASVATVGGVLEESEIRGKYSPGNRGRARFPLTLKAAPLRSDGIDVKKNKHLEVTLDKFTSINLRSLGNTYIMVLS